MLAYKAVQENRQSYISEIIYADGGEFVEPNINASPELHGKGLTVGTLEWAKQRVAEWGGIILEVEIPEEDNVVVYPVGGKGKFRVKRLVVLGEREIIH